MRVLILRNTPTDETLGKLGPRNCEFYLESDIEAVRDALDGAGRKVEFYFYLRRNLAELERKITHITFALGCTPMVNLYQKRADPIQLDQTQTEYRVVPDQRHPRAAEVYSVDRVVATGS